MEEHTKFIKEWCKNHQNSTAMMKVWEKAHLIRKNKISWNRQAMSAWTVPDWKAQAPSIPEPK